MWAFSPMLDVTIFHNKTTMLVPVPKSSIQKNELCIPQRITKALENNGLGISEECLFRSKPLRKSATTSGTNRPKAFQHYESMELRESLIPNKSFW